MTKPVVPGANAPSNLHLGPGTKAAMIESDMYDICNRIREISPNLFIIELADDVRCSYLIMELCEDGTERFVMKTPDLDPRILLKLEYMLKVPFEQRLQKCEEQIDKDEAQRELEQEEDMWEKVGRPMWSELAKCGFIQRQVSYPKAGKLL